jgi:ABC-type uncharacterized transport system substrate-binding protein
MDIHVFHASNESDPRRGVCSDGTTASRRTCGRLRYFFVRPTGQIVSLATHYRIPAIYYLREFARAGGLMAYGNRLADAYRLVGMYVGRVLKGEKPADLPVLQADTFEFVINLKTAMALNITVPNSLQLLADEMIE